MGKKESSRSVVIRRQILQLICWKETVSPGHELYEEEDEEPEKLEDISRGRIWRRTVYRDRRTDAGIGMCWKRNHCNIPASGRFEIFETYKPGCSALRCSRRRSVCGGFAAPIREDYAEKVLIVTSGEKMAFYAADNISKAVKNFEDRSYARVFGIVLNHRNVENETEKSRDICKRAWI